MLTEIVTLKEPQTTINKPVRISGRSALTLMPATAVLLPAEADAGISFVNADHALKLGPLAVALNPLHGFDLDDGFEKILTVTHTCSALFGMGIDNACITLLGGDSPPEKDSSPAICVQSILRTGLTELAAPRRRLAVRQTGRIIGTDGSFVEFHPSSSFSVEIVSDYPHPIGLQAASYSEGRDDYLKQLSWAREAASYPLANSDPRRFLVEQMSDKPLVLFTDHKVLTAKRAPDEPGRHDVIDFLGFLSALPFRPLGRFLVFRYNPHLCLKLISSIYASIPPNDSK